MQVKLTKTPDEAGVGVKGGEPVLMLGEGTVITAGFVDKLAVLLAPVVWPTVAGLREVVSATDLNQ